MASRGLLTLLAIRAVNEYYSLPWKPPITAALVAANTIVHLRPRFLRHVIPSIDRVLFNSYVVFKRRDLTRLLLSPFYHLNDSHLFYNMVSLLWKGVRLETQMGSLEFASMVATLLGFSQVATLLLSKAMVYLDYDYPYYREYSAGFSGVLFAMKVVLNSSASEHDLSYVSGIAVPARYAAWAELILVQLLVPGVSFWGHFGGLVAGVVYVKLRRFCSGSDPLGFLIRCAIRAAGWPFRVGRRWRGRGRVSGGYSSGEDENRRWSCGMCTFVNSGMLDECEMCGSDRGGVMATSPRFSSGEVSAEEIRRRRIQRFNR